MEKLILDLIEENRGLHYAGGYLSFNDIVQLVRRVVKNTSHLDNKVLVALNELSIDRKVDRYDAIEGVYYRIARSSNEVLIHEED
jgi:uncharacterized membrane protein